MSRVEPALAERPVAQRERRLGRVAAVPSARARGTQPSSVSEPPISQVSGSQRRTRRDRGPAPSPTPLDRRTCRCPRSSQRRASAAIAVLDLGERRRAAVADVAHGLRIGERLPRGRLRPRREACAAAAVRSRSSGMRPDRRARPYPGKLHRLARRRAEPSRHALRRDVGRNDQRDHARSLSQLARGERRLGRVALAPVLVRERPGQLRLRVRRARPRPAAPGRRS